MNLIERLSERATDIELSDPETAALLRETVVELRTLLQDEVRIEEREARFHRKNKG